MNDVIEVGGGNTGAKINLTIDLAPPDCYVMCKQLFSRLEEVEKRDIVDEYLKSKGVSFNLCEETEE